MDASSYRSEVMHGLALQGAGFLWVCLEYAAGLHTTRIAYHPVVTNVFAVVPIYLMYRALRVRRDREGGLSWGQGLRSGMAVSAVAALLATPSTWLFATAVNPRFFAAMADHAVATGHATRAQASQYFTLANYCVQAVIGALVMGLVTTLVVTAVLRRRRPAPAAA